MAGVLDVPRVAASGFALAPVAPNPARGVVRVDFALPRQAPVRVEVLDVQGRVVATLADAVYPPGWHHLEWNGRAAAGRVPPGLYLVRMTAPGRKLIARFVLLS